MTSANPPRTSWFRRAKPQAQELTPEEIHRALPVLQAQSGLWLLLFTTIALFTVAFLVFGQIPITATGNGLLLTRNTLVTFQSTASGQLSAWRVRVGDFVEAGQVVAELQQPDTERQLLQTRQQLADVQEKNAVIASLTLRYLDLERDILARRRDIFATRIALQQEQVNRSGELAKRNHQQRLRHLEQQRDNVAAVVALENERRASLHTTQKRLEELRRQQLRSADQVLLARQQTSQQGIRVAESELQLLQLDFDRIRAEQTYLDALNRLAERQDAVLDLTLDQEELAKNLADLDKRQAELRFLMEHEEAELQRTINRLAEQLAESRDLQVETSGRVVELTQAPGALIGRGTRLGTLDTRRGEERLEAVAYFKLDDGKRIQPGMTLRLTPAPVERERFGSVLAQVTAVSSFAVTPEAASLVVGNTEVARQLTRDNHQIEVFAELLIDPRDPQRYRWDLSRGPALTLTAGTLATAWIHLEEKSPLALIIPIFGVATP